MSTILAAVDPQHHPERVLREAVAAARAEGARLVVLHVVPNPWVRHPLMPWRFDPAGSDPTLGMRLRIGEALTGLARLTEGAADLAIDVRVEPGRPDVVIVEQAESLDASLIVIGAPEAWRVGASGTVAERVVQHAHGPVLAVREGPADGPVLAATDLSDPSLPAIAAGSVMAGRTGAPLVAMHVVDLSQFVMMSGLAEATPAVPLPSMWPEMGDEARRQLDAALALVGARAEVLVEPGIPAQAIVEAAVTRHARLVVVGTIGATGLRRLLLGSVARSVLRDAPCSVLVVRLQTPFDPAAAAAVRIVPKPA
jgi:nucleotide-binding universal stress UspA family protein